MRSIPFVLVLTSCWTSSQPTDSPKAAAAPVEVAIASIRLADDCPDAAAAASEPAMGSMAGDCAAEGCGSFARMCEQTLLQVSLRSTASDRTTVAVKKVELLDGDGNPIGSLTARTATRWSADGSYAKWDQVVAPGEVMAASYALTSPDWTKVPGGRDPARKVRVRVTFTVGSGEKTYEKEAMIAAFSDPNVVT